MRLSEYLSLSWRHLPLKAGGVLVLVIAFYMVKDQGLASIQYYQVKNALAQWQRQPQVAQTDYLQILRTMHQVTARHPNNPLYLDTLAQVLEWGYLEGFGSDDSLHRAEKLYLASTRLRPSWPTTWASLAMLKWRMAEFDQEMFDYLEKADRLGPASPEVHLLFAELGLTLYQSNSLMFKPLREQVIQRMDLALRHPKSTRRIKAFIQQKDAQGLVCAWLQDKPRSVRQKVCPS